MRLDYTPGHSGPCSRLIGDALRARTAPRRRRCALRRERNPAEWFAAHGARNRRRGSALARARSSTTSSRAVDARYPALLAELPRRAARAVTCTAILAAGMAATGDRGLTQSDPARSRQRAQLRRASCALRARHHERTGHRHRRCEPPGALDADGVTIAVCGTGLDVDLPAPQATLARADRDARRTGERVPARHTADQGQFSAPQPHHQRPCPSARWWSRRPCKAAR